MPSIEAQSSPFWIIGYGNPQRRDDGIGPYVVSRLNGVLSQEKIHVLSLHQLDPDVIEGLQYAKIVILVDATMEKVEGGWQWVRIQPELGVLPYATHHLKPSFLLGLLQSVYHRCPLTWLVSVQGNDFGFGEGLTPEAEKRAQIVVSEIVKFLLNKKVIDKIEHL